MTAPQGALVPAATLSAFAAEVFDACGLPPAQASELAGLMVGADLIGSDAHGIFRLSQYVGWMKAGRINPRPDIKIVEQSPATALIDGDNGMGHLVMAHAARTAIEMAKTSGVAWVGARRSNHAGAAALYASMPVEHGMIGVYSAVSSANHMAPWGGAEPLLGTNPLAFGIPAGDEPPVIFDMATSVAAFGKIRTHQLENKPMPEGWVISRSTGGPLTDAKQMKDGLLLPIGGYKGSGLALIIGLIAGTLNNAYFGRDVKDYNSAKIEESNTGQMIIVLDVSRFVPLDQFKAEVDRHMRDLRDCARLPGVEAIRVPGEQSHQRKVQRSAAGVPVSPALLDDLDKAAASVGCQTLSGRLG
jgi:LDH2 family malate/lactate/ureidoglycolate dehydrogenase